MTRFILAAVIWLAASPLFAANVRWTGAAQDVRGVWTITVTGTWATADTATLTINNKSLTVTVGSSTSTSNVADIIARAIDAANTTEDLLGNETRNFGGEEIPEFAELDATSSGAVITITTEEPGVSLTAASGSVALTRSEATAGDGALGAVTQVTAATGKNWLNNANNYTDRDADGDNDIPIDNDTLIFDSGDVDVLYALDHFRANNIDLTVLVTNDYTGQFGNPVESPLGYTEYRARFYQQRGGSKSFTLEKGVNGNTDCGILYLDFQDQASDKIIINASRKSDLTFPGVYLCGADTTTSHAFTSITAGHVVIEPTFAPTASGKGYFNSPYFIGELGKGDAEPIVTLGAAVRLNAGGSDLLHQYSGQLYVDTEASDGIVTNSTEFRIRGGRLTYRYSSSLPLVTIDRGGTLAVEGVQNSGGITIASVIKVVGGTVDLSKAPVITQAANFFLYAGSTLNYPVYNGLDDISLKGCRLDEVNIILPSDRLIDVSTAAP